MTDIVGIADDAGIDGRKRVERGRQTMTKPGARIWQTPEKVQRFLTGTRAQIPMAAEQLAVMLNVVRRARPQISRLLDVGSGDGILSRLLLEAYPAARTVLVDYSEPMLSAAREHFSPDRADIFLRDLNDPAWIDAVLPFAPFDAVVSGYAIHHLTDARKQSLYQQIFDLLAPGGVFVNIEHVASPSVFVEDLFIHAFAEGLYEMTQARGDPMTYEAIVARLHEDDGDIVAPVETQCVWLRNVGFGDVDCYMKIYAFAVFGGIKP